MLSVRRLLPQNEDTLIDSKSTMLLLRILWTFAIINTIRSSPQSELNEIIDEVILGHNDNEKLLKVISSVDALNSRLTKGASLAHRPWNMEQKTAIEATAVALYSHMKLQDACRDIEKVLANTYSNEVTLAHNVVTNAIMGRSVTADSAAYAILLMLQEKNNRLATALREGLTSTKIFVSRHEKLRHFQVPGLTDAHASPKGILKLAARTVDFSQPPAWLGNIQSIHWDEGSDQNNYFHEGGSAPHLLDVVIPVHPKDAATVPFVVAQLKKNCDQIGEIFIVSSERSTCPAGTTFVDEADFPFNSSAPFCKETFQQLLKLLFPFVVPRAREQILILDSDVVWLRKVRFINDLGQPYLNAGTFLSSWASSRGYADGGKGHSDFVASLLGQRRPAEEMTLGRHAVVHHMVVDRKVLRELFKHVARRASTALGSIILWPSWMVFVELFDAHHTERWRLYSDTPDGSNLPYGVQYIEQLHESSEYELYDTFASYVSRSAKVERRVLQYADIGHCCFHQDGQLVSGCDVDQMTSDLGEHWQLDYVACHSHMRPIQEGGRSLNQMITADNFRRGLYSADASEGTEEGAN